MTNLCAGSLTKTPDFQSGDGGSHPTPALHFWVQEISLADAEAILIPFHYLSKISKRPKSKRNYGLFVDGKLSGACIFTGFPVPELVVGMFGLPRNDQKGFWELSRLCLIPTVQSEKGQNFASRFVSVCIKNLRKSEVVRAILSYADADFHRGTVYRALGFRYFGLSAPKKDFWAKQPDGSLKKCSRGGSLKSREGVWMPRSQKHRYVKLFDEQLQIRWVEKI